MKRVALKLLLTATMLYPAMVFAGDPARDGLFRIERNKNANIVQYDARVTEDGKLDSKQPVSWVEVLWSGKMEEIIGQWVELTEWIVISKKYSFTLPAKVHQPKSIILSCTVKL